MLSSFMASFCSMLFMAFMVFQSSLASPTYHQVDYMKFSTISAAPALLPGAPLSPLSSSPTPSPDITPLFPSPGGVPLSPSQSSLPTIPSSPSPPNPDYVAAPGPDFAFPPSGTSLPASSSVSVTSSQPIKMVAFLVLVVVCTMWLSGM